MHTFLIVPVFLIPLVALVAGPLIKLAVDAAKPKIPKRLRAPVALLGGAAVGGVAAAVGVPVDQALAIAGATGAAAQMAHAVHGAVRKPRPEQK